LAMLIGRRYFCNSYLPVGVYCRVLVHKGNEVTVKGGIMYELKEVHYPP